MSMWTDRAVRFTPVPRHSEAEWETFFESIPDHYWERPGWVRRFLEPFIAAHSGVVTVGNFPWWMPRWWALRTVVRLAHDAGLAGDAVYVIERTSQPR